MTTPHSRRTITKGLFLGIPLATLGLATAGATVIQPNQYTSKTLLENARNVRLYKSINPNLIPVTGSRWYQRLQTRSGSNGNLYSILSLKDSRTANLKLEFTLNGVTTTKASKDFPASMMGKPFEMYLTVDGDNVLATVWHNKVQQARLTATGANQFNGTTSSTAAYVEGNRAIDFRETTRAEILGGTTEPTKPSTSNESGPGQLAYPGFVLRLNEQFDKPIDEKNIWNIRDSGTFATTGRNSSTGYASISGSSLAYDLRENVEFGNGVAKIWVRKAAKAWKSPYTSGTTAGKTLTHTSGYLDTCGKLEQHYGRWEIRCKAPFSNKRAVWGGMWLMGNKSYPLKGRDAYWEVDINEGYGKNELHNTTIDPSNRAESTIHFAEIGTALAQQSSHKKVAKLSPHDVEGFEDEFHTWAVEITPKGIEFFYDNATTPYHSLYAKDHPVLAQRLKDPNQLFNIRINLMTGNPYWNILDTDEEMAKPLEVDYVRVWKYTG